MIRRSRRTRQYSVPSSPVSPESDLPAAYPNLSDLKRSPSPELVIQRLLDGLPYEDSQCSRPEQINAPVDPDSVHTPEAYREEPLRTQPSQEAMNQEVMAPFVESALDWSYDVQPWSAPGRLNDLQQQQGEPEYVPPYLAITYDGSISKCEDAPTLPEEKAWTEDCIDPPQRLSYIWPSDAQYANETDTVLESVFQSAFDVYDRNSQPTEIQQYSHPLQLYHQPQQRHYELYRPTVYEPQGGVWLPSPDLQSTEQNPFSFHMGEMNGSQQLGEGQEVQRQESPATERDAATENEEWSGEGTTTTVEESYRIQWR